jgi:hypothetical protein
MSDEGTATVDTGPAEIRRGHDGRWLPGTSGNPTGPKPGFRHKATVAVESLLAGEADKLTRRAIDKALEGDVKALRLCLERVAPARRSPTVSFALPKMETAADAVTALNALAEAVATGELSPAEGAEFSKLIDSFTRAIETHDLAARIERLEGLKK